jgi:hypothetical protein
VRTERLAACCNHGKQWRGMRISEFAQVTFAALVEVIAGHAPAALRLEPLVPALMQLLAFHQDSWAGLQAARGSALHTLASMLCAAGSPEARLRTPVAADAVERALMNEETVGLLLRHAMRGPVSSTGHSAACVHHLAQQRGFQVACIGPAGLQVCYLIPHNVA